MLKTDPKYGVFPRWPEDGDDWLHPEDVAIARDLIPSQRIFRRDGADGPYSVFHYGDSRFRARGALWIEVEPGPFDIGDWVEVRSRGMQQTPRTGCICDMHFNEHARRIEYRIEEQGMPIETIYHAEDLRPVEPTKPSTWSDEIRR